MSLLVEHDPLDTVGLCEGLALLKASKMLPVFVASAPSYADSHLGLLRLFRTHSVGENRKISAQQVRTALL